ncbi:hypothetical protein BCBBV1cgp55 [Bacillus phage BCASJ1c]|uniref:55 n=1 Tax=Bacillus phage BCASJ1c TaxID=294382 RepID=Q5YA55_9CAUD|nr:hypothetical protein [Evansella clarkii]YP_164433.1 hypothetical protein BCBBV1cgp55 [Bacillus phage BCASJ1c]AAU85102.1 55 [Bacillus phage BCASJ1c]
MGLVTNLEIRINSIQFVDDERVNVRFQGVDQEGQINLNGYVVATQMEYFQNAGMDPLKELVKQKIVERIEGTGVEEEGAAE